ncbi:hypothetical protein ACFLS4_06110 [Bacteroidota bacterium]
MKVLKIKLVIFNLLLVIGLFVSCEENDKTEYKSYIIQIDSVEVSNNVVANIPVDIYFYGTVGTDGCYKFSHFKTDKLNNEILVECSGKQNVTSGACPTVMVYLNGEKLSYLFEETGNYLIRIKQPDNSFLEKEIIVE